MKLISWNVNGLRACINKGFMDFFSSVNADIFCIQESKMQQNQSVFKFDGYCEFWNDAEKKGYSGTVIFSKDNPIKVTNGIGIPYHDKEGRVIVAEYEKFILINVYTPNSKAELERLEYRKNWEDDFKNFLKKIEKDSKKNLIVCGDLNVAHKEIDLKNPKANKNSPGFTNEERTKFESLLNSGFTDSFRYLYPNLENAYTWWSYIAKARERNVGWRIDYFLVSNSIAQNIMGAKIHSEIFGSDHCPIELEIKEE